MEPEINLAALEAERDEVELALVQIKAQINGAKANRIGTGEYSDPDWWHRAHTALRYKGQRHQWLLRTIAEAKRKSKSTTTKSLESRFVDAAKRRLDSSLFEELIEEAKCDNG